MAQLKHARSFRDLVVYQRTRRVAKDVFEVTKGFPKEERYSLTDADGEQQETQHWIESAHDCGYLTRQQRDKFVADLSEVVRMLESMMQKSSSFCGQNNLMVREDRTEYFVTDN